MSPWYERWLDDGDEPLDYAPDRAPDAPWRLRAVRILGVTARSAVVAVGDLGGRWVGLVSTRPDDWEPATCWILPTVAEGVCLGLLDQAEAIRRTTALAQADDALWGPVVRWEVPAGERGDPEAYRCRHCGEVCCTPLGASCLDEDED